MEKTILVTGATGSIGSEVTRRLAARGRVRAFVRDRAKAVSLERAGAEIASGDFEQPGALAAAMDGVGSLVLITAPGPTASAQTAAAINAARKTGVERIVRVSVIQPDARLPTDNVRQHAASDAQIRQSGVAFTLLRPSFFMQNFLAAGPSIRAEGKMYWGMRGGRIGMIDVRDIIDVAVAVTLERGHDNQVYVLTGPAALTFGQTAEILSRVLGRAISYVPISPEEVEASLRAAGMSDWLSAVLRDYARAYGDNWGDFVTSDVEKVLGRPSRSFEDFAREVLAPVLARPD